MEGNDLVFVFEDDISYHDGITQSRPGVKSLVIRYHLADDLGDVGYCSIIIKLWSAGSIILDMTVDSVEYQWISDKK